MTRKRQGGKEYFVVEEAYDSSSLVGQAPTMFEVSGPTEGAIKTVKWIDADDYTVYEVLVFGKNGAELDRTTYSDYSRKKISDEEFVVPDGYETTKVDNFQAYISEVSAILRPDFAKTAAAAERRKELYRTAITETADRARKNARETAASPAASGTKSIVLPPEANNRSRFWLAVNVAVITLSFLSYGYMRNRKRSQLNESSTDAK